MISFLRKIRRSLIESNSTKKYLLYAIGEILLVMVGILLALQVNNWNEGKKAKNEFQQSMLSLAEDIKKDTANFQFFINELYEHEVAADVLIPVLESRSEISDSMELMNHFIVLSNGINVNSDSEVWDEIRKTGLQNRFGDPLEVEAIQIYYRYFKSEVANWSFAQESVLEMRKLKYKLWKQSDLNQIRLYDPPRKPSDEAFVAILEEPQVVVLTRTISFTAKRWQNVFKGLIDQAVLIIDSIEMKYGSESI